MAFTDDVNKYNEMINKDRIRAIMQAQAELESSSGKNVDHKTINYSSMHQGTAAKGRYGIMPATLRDLAKGMGRDKEAQEAASIQDEQTLKDYFASHPALEDRLAMQYIEQANKSMGGDYDPEKITYAWQWGQNKTPQQFEEDKKNNPEVNKRWAKVKGLFKDPHPPMLPAGRNTEESEFAAAKLPSEEESVPTPVANMSPFQESVPEEVVAPKVDEPKQLAPEKEPVKKQPLRTQQIPLVNNTTEQQEDVLPPGKMRQLMALMSVRRK